MAVTRNIQFFLALTRAEDGGEPPKYDPSDALARIDAMEWSDRYDENGERILRLWPRNGKPSGMLGTVRRTALPPVDRGATIGDLGLQEHEGIIEQTFFTIYDGKYVGIVRNQYGPGISRLADYLDNKTGDFHQPVEFKPLVSPDTVDQLAKMRKLRVMTLKVRSDAVSALQNEETIYEALDPSRRLADDVETIEISLSVAHKREASLGAPFVNLVRRLSRRADLGDLATKFEVTYDDDDDARRTVNVLDDRLMSKQEIETTAQRAGRLKDESAYDAIDSAYEELKDKLETAAALEMDE